MMYIFYFKKKSRSITNNDTEVYILHPCIYSLRRKTHAMGEVGIVICG